MDGSMINKLQTSMYEWTQTDDQIKQLNQQCSELRKQRDNLQTHVITMIQEHNLQDNLFQIPTLQTNISCKSHKTSETISFKFLEEKFNEYFSSPEECQALLQFLKDKRKHETSLVLKRSSLK